VSIATRTGDSGETSLMYGKRIPKDHPRVEAYGTIDELNAALGLARATASNDWIKEQLLITQKDLVAIMGELAVAEEDLPRYQAADYPKLVPEMLARLDKVVKKIEDQSVRFDGWATPGGTLHAATLDVARTVCRRAERYVYRLQKESPCVRNLTLHYLNRLSDALWLMARRDESLAT
jgi:cob(I)alamin adenosyltransferase